MVDYVKLSNTALRLITENGREITFITLDKGKDDVAQPWRGKEDPRATPAATKTAFAAFVPPSSLTSLGYTSDASEDVKRSEQIALVSLGATDQTDLTKFDEIIDDDGTIWRITFSDKLRPGVETVMFIVGVRR